MLQLNWTAEEILTQEGWGIRTPTYKGRVCNKHKKMCIFAHLFICYQS